MAGGQIFIRGKHGVYINFLSRREGSKLGGGVKSWKMIASHAVKEERGVEGEERRREGEGRRREEKERRREGEEERKLDHNGKRHSDHKREEFKRRDSIEQEKREESRRDSVRREEVKGEEGTKKLSKSWKTTIASVAAVEKMR